MTNMYFELELVLGGEIAQVQSYNLVTAACQDGCRFRKVFDRVELYLVEGDRRLLLHTWTGKGGN